MSEQGDSKIPKKIFLSVGESSGDRLAAELAIELRQLQPTVEISGITGPQMRRSGVTSWHDMSSLAVIGFSAALAKIAELKLLQKDLLERIQRFQPDVCVLVDYPGFHLDLGEQIRLRQIPTILYVAPQMWAWGQYRAKKLPDQVDLILGVLPFEETFFRNFKVEFSYIGSPILDRIDAAKSRANIRKSPGKKLIGFFPGSRNSEFGTLSPIMFEIAKRLSATGYECRINIAPSIDSTRLEGCIEKIAPKTSAARNLGSPHNFQIEGITFSREDSLEAMMRSDFAVVTSGTATLECALAGTPLSVMYKVGKLNYLLIKRLVKSKYIALPNLILDRLAFREFIQEIKPEDVASHVISSLESESQLRQLSSSLTELRGRLKKGASLQAAKKILSFPQSRTSFDT